MMPIASAMLLSPSNGGVVTYPFGFQNPGAETGNMTGWTQDSGGPASSITTTGAGYPGPHTGSNYFVGALSAASSIFSQVLDIPSGYHSDIDAGLRAALLTAYKAGSGGTNDTGSLILECLDSGGSTLSSYTAVNWNGNETWYQKQAKIAAPSGTRKVRVGATNTRAEGAVLDSYWDDFAFDLPTLLTLWTNTGGSGNRSGIITVAATNITAGGGAVGDLVDGSQSNSYWWNSATGDGSGYIRFDFGSARIIDAFRWYQSNTTGHGTWRFEGSNDASSWTQLDSDFTLNGNVSGGTLAGNTGLYVFSNTTAYRYYRLRHMSGSRSTSPYLREIDFRIL